MKKKILATALCIGCIGLLTSARITAAEANVKSIGNIKLGSGDKVAFYAEDIYYLKGELAKLFEEID